MLGDIRYAVRTLAASTGFTVAAILTLALGIGANTALFSLVNATLLSRLPVQHADRLASVYRGTGRLGFRAHRPANLVEDETERGFRDEDVPPDAPLPRLPKCREEVRADDVRGAPR